MDRSGLTVVGGENDFYKLKDLTVQDVDRLKLFIDGLPEIGWKGHNEFLDMYLRPIRLRKIFKKRGIENPDAMKQLDVLISNLHETYHAAIEREFWPYLEIIKKRYFSFLEDPTTACGFFHGLHMQYTRTRAIKERARQRENVLFEDIERVWDVMSHIIAVEAGRSFYCSREELPNSGARQRHPSALHYI